MRQAGRLGGEEGDRKKRGGGKKRKRKRGGGDGRRWEGKEMMRKDSRMGQKHGRRAWHVGAICVI